MSWASPTVLAEYISHRFCCVCEWDKFLFAREKCWEIMQKKDENINWIYAAASENWIHT